MRTRELTGLVLTAVLTLAACSSGGGSTGGSTSGGNQAGNAADGFEGSLATSGLYAATWTASPESEADVFNSSSSVTLASDHQTYGNVRVNPDGSISFGSAATELASNGAYKGSGATVTLDRSGQFVCAFSVDTDLTGTTDGAILHMKGTMSVRWHPQGIGDLTCP